MYTNDIGEHVKRRSRYHLERIDISLGEIEQAIACGHRMHRRANASGLQVSFDYAVTHICTRMIWVGMSKGVPDTILNALISAWVKSSKPFHAHNACTGVRMHRGCE